MSRVFLTAEWRNLILITYNVPGEILTPHLPPGLELDTINGESFASLVAFDFVNTRVKGRQIPFHVNFPEINLRFYVKEKESNKRGVVFIREFVPRYFISLIANRVYNEPYKSLRMQSVLSKNGAVQVRHDIKYKGGNFFVSAEAENKSYLPGIDSNEHFFKEHSWGYGLNRKGQTLVYKVEHPYWNVYPLLTYDHNFDFARIYGEKWSFLNGAEPYCVILAEGSAINVFSAELLH